MNTHLLHQRAVSLAKTFKQSESDLLGVLISMREADAFRLLRYPNLFIYCTKGLGLSEAQACYFSKVARKSEEVPALKAAIDEGTLSLSQARRVVAVITQENSKEWIEKAATLPQRELERAVTIANPKATVREKIRPIAPTRSELRVGISVELEAKLGRVREVLAASKGVVTLEVALEEMAALFLKHKDPVEKAKRACAKSLSSGRSKLGEAGVPTVPPVAARKALPAAIQHEVNKRDGARCQALLPNRQPCLSRQWVEHHHITPKSHGGKDIASNLITLCSQHHKIEHRPGLYDVGHYPGPLQR